MKWTEEQTKKLIELDKLRYPNYVIAEYLGCTESQVKDKLAHWRKKNNQYNVDHIGEKYAINTDFYYDLPNPKTILDPFCGTNRFWKTRFEKDDIIVLDNDRDRAIKADFHEDAKILLDNFAKFGFKFDIVDIDPFGDCVEYIRSGIRLAKKGLIVTNGYIKNGARFQSTYWEQNYGKEFLPDQEHLISFIQELGKECGKTLKVYGVSPKEWTNCDRIWFTIEKSGN